MEPDDFEEPSTSCKPWPLAFAIFGLGCMGAAIYAMVHYAATH